MSNQSRGVFHIHTQHSFDCLTSPGRIVQWAKRRSVRVLGITDHDTIRGALEAADYAKQTDVQVIIGAEYATDHGDIIGLFLTEEIHSRRSFEVIEAIKSQGGVSVLPHPFHGHDIIAKLADAVDMIEVFNARCSDNQNRQALELARSLGKPIIGGADAHFLRDLECCVNHYESGACLTAGSFLKAQWAWNGRRSSMANLHLSQAIKGWKTNDRVLLRSHLRAVLLSCARTTVGEKAWGRLRSAAGRRG